MRRIGRLAASASLCVGNLAPTPADEASSQDRTSSMIVTNHFPAAPLNSYINYFWYCEGPLPYPRLKVLPMPSLHLMINFGDSYNVYEPNHIGPLVTCAESWSVGLWNSYHLIDCPQNMQLLSVSFKPGGAYPFLQLPQSELHNQIISLDTIWGRWAAEIRERLYGAPTIQARFALLEQLLLGRLCDGPPGLQTAPYSLPEIPTHRPPPSIPSLTHPLPFPP